MNLKTKRAICWMVGIMSILVIVGTVTYAYFTTGGDYKNLNATLSTATLALRFADNDNGINANLNFGEMVTKKFLIENVGTAEASLSLDWKDMINTYINGSLTYRLTYSDSEDGEYVELIPNSNVPVSAEPISQTMASEVSVPAGKTYYYNLEVTLHDLPDIDQTSDLGAIFNTMFDVGQAIKYRYYTLRVNPNGGVWGEYAETQEYLLKNKETQSIANPTRVGYTFGGWNIIGGVASNVEDGVFTMGISDVELQAKWIADKYILTIDPNGGSYVGETSQSIEYGSTVTIYNPIREGYTFIGWTVSAGVLDGSSFTLSEPKDATLIANWQVNNYKYIVYHSQMNTSGTGYTLVGADTDEGEAEYNTTVTPGVKTYTGFISPAVQSLLIAAETVYPPEQNRVEYKYDRTQHTLTIDANGGTYGGNASVVMYYEAIVTLNTPIKTGYNFASWTANTGEINGNLFTIGNGDATVTANYTPKVFSVTFNANGGTTPTPSKTVVYDSTYGDLPTPTYTGYKFLGWFTAISGGKQIVASTQVALSDNQILYAQWEKIPPTQVTLAQLNVTSQGVRTNFDEPATTDEGVFEMEDDYGISYYYRGAVTNNYVYFAGFYWRIIRVNGDGSLRIVYDGTQAWENGAYSSARFIGTSAFNTNTNDAKYVGYMYGPAGTTASTSKAQAQTNTTSSTIKTYIDNWYKTNIVDKGYESAVADVLFCNDRSTPGKATTGLSSDTSLGYGTNITAFGAYVKSAVESLNTAQPTFKCPQQNDAFTVSDTVHGNGALTYPVGLITANEIVAAGSGKYNTKNTSYYLYRPSNTWWSLSPCYYNAGARLFYVYTSGFLGNYLVDIDGAVAPVINLSAEYAVTLRGTGTMTDPYTA